jgi:hypothetical protein
VSDLVKGLREAATGEGGLDYGDLWAYCDEAADEIERLSAELAEARLDAERYRWLIENAVIETDGWRSDGRDPATTKQPVDAAIDAARKETP